MDGRFVAYYRVSTDRQGRSGLGLEAQQETVRGFLNGGDWHLVGEFVEVESGRLAERPQLAKALAQCRVMGATLVVANVSRLTRSVAFLSRLLEAGVDVRFCDLPQIEGPTGKFMLQQMAAVAELEAGLIGDRTRKALARKRAWYENLTDEQWAELSADGKNTRLGNPCNLRNEEAGRVNGRAARTKKATERAADLAPVIADLQVSGILSLRQIAAGLNKRGVRTPRGGEWNAVQVKRVLGRAKD